MKILFKNNTKYTRHKYNAFIEFHRDKYGKKIIFKTILIALCILYIIIFNIIYLNWKVIISILTIGLIIYLVNNLRKNKQIKSNNKVIYKQKDFTFYFYKNCIKIKCGRKFDRLRYFEIYRAFETKDYFFLYTDEKHSLIISKDGFTIGTDKGFSEFIKKKCLLKYRKEN